MTIETLVPNADHTLGSFIDTPAGDAHFLDIDEDPASHDGDTSYVSGPNRVASEMFVGLTDTGGAFDPSGVTAITIDVAHELVSSGVSNGVDVIEHFYQVFKSDESTALTNEVGGIVTSTTYIREQLAATQQGTPTKADWDGARLRIRQTYTAAGMADTISRGRIPAARVLVDWTAPPAGADLVIDNGAHAHTADNLTLTEQAPAVDLFIHDSAHGHASGPQIALGQDHNLAVGNAAHAHSADNLTLSAAGATDLVIQNASHSHTAQNAALSQVHALQIQNGAHGHTASSPVLVHIHNIQIANASHLHSAQNVALSLPGGLGVQDSQHAHTASNLVLTQVHVLQIDSSNHAHSATSPALTLGTLTIQNAVHGHTAGNITLTGPVQFNPTPRRSTTTTARRSTTATPRRETVGTARRG